MVRLRWAATLVRGSLRITLGGWGTVILFAYVRRFVSCPARARWLWPAMAAAAAVAGVLGAGGLMLDVSPVTVFFSKIGLVLLLYGGILWAAERQQIAAQVSCLSRKVTATTL